MIAPMFVLLKKEVSQFFSSITGYIMVVLFLVTIGLFMWVFPGATNVLDSGYATLDTLFELAPWVFLFLVPAVTMRMFADEQKSGTMELLLTRPLTDMQIVLSKYLAAVVLILLALLPTLVFYYSVVRLGNPVGNLDVGGTWGSYIGLFFLAAVYASLGIFASSLTQNSIVAFLITVALAFFLYVGFDSISTLPIFGNADTVLTKLGIQEHYQSISRGVIDSRDIIYFISVIVIFLFFTRTVLQSRKW